MIWFLLNLILGEPHVERSGEIIEVTGSGELLSSHFSEIPKSSIKNVTLQGINILGEELFSGFSKLLYLKIPDSVVQIKYKSFANSGLQIVDIGFQVTDIATVSLFYESYDLISINIKSKNEKYSSHGGALYSADFKILYILPPKSTCQLKDGVEILESLSIYQYNSETLTIPDSVTTIKSQGFADCINIKNIYFSKNSNLSEINDYAFWRTMFRSFECPTKVKSIGVQSFYSCGLINFTFMKNSSLRSIKLKAFDSCTLLSAVYLPASTSSINDDAFFSCSSLSLVDIEKGNKFFGSLDGVIYTADYSSIKFIPPSKSPSITIHSNTTSIAQGSLQLCTKIKEIIIQFGNIFLSEENGIIYDINKITAKYCIGSIKEANLTTTCNKLSESLFQYVSTLQSIQFPRNCEIKEIPPYCFDNSGIQSIDLPSSITAILKNGFSNSQLAHVRLSENINHISEYAFYSTSKLTSFEFTGQCSLINIEEYAFSGSSITDINLPDSLLNLSVEIFRGSALQRLKIPDSCESILSNSFSSSSIQTITASERCLLREIKASSFLNCARLTSIQLPPKLESIASESFSGCSLLGEVTWIGTPIIKTLSISTFLNCASLTQFEIPPSVTTVSTETFRGCHNLTKFILQNSERYKLIDGVLFNHNETILEVFPPGKTSFTIPQKTLEIAPMSFYYCEMLSNLNFEAKCGVSFINEMTFFCCSKLSKISFQSIMSRIEQSAFEGCSSLSEVLFENDSQLISIGSNVFADCKSLTHVEFLGSSGLQTLGIAAFRGCSKLSDFVFGNNCPICTISDECFKHCSSLETLSLPSAVSSLGKSSFEQCSKLKEIEINGPIYLIGDNCFDGCSSLVNVSLSGYNSSNGSVLEIGLCSFRGCGSLIELRLPSFLASVGTGAFDGCVALASVFYCGTLNFESSSIPCPDGVAFVMSSYWRSSFLGLAARPVMLSCNMLPTIPFTLPVPNSNAGAIVLGVQSLSDFAG